MMTTHQAFMLLLLTLGAFLVPLVSERLHLFAAPTEMLYGLLIANFVPGADEAGTFVAALGNFGLLLLLFLAGLEIDFDLIARRGAAMLGYSIGAALGLQLLGVVVGLIFHWPLINLLVLAAISVSVLLVILRQAGLHESPFGQTLLVIGAIGEFLAIVELTAYDLVNQYGLDWTLLLAALKLAAILLLGYAALRVLRAATSGHPERFARFLAAHDTAELGVRAALALMLAFAAVAVFLQVDQILATFIAGVVCSFAFRGRNALTEKMMTLGQGFFLPIFFITVGLGLRLGDLLHGASFVFLLQLLVAMLVSRLLFIPLLKVAGLSWASATGGALLLAAPLTLQVAIVKVGIDLGQIPEREQGIVLGAAIAGAFLFPLLARLVLAPGLGARRILVRLRSVARVLVMPQSSASCSYGIFANHAGMRLLRTLGFVMTRFFLSSRT
jgi:Kef-type K+ transport system membrane component KefB